MIVSAHVYVQVISDKNEHRHITIAVLKLICKNLTVKPMQVIKFYEDYKEEFQAQTESVLSVKTQADLNQ